MFWLVRPVHIAHVYSSRIEEKKSSPESESSKLATSFDIHEGFKEEDVQVFGGTSEVLCQPLVSICIVRPAC